MSDVRCEARGLCPLAGFAECRGEQCALWDDDWTVCSLSSGSRYSGIRAAVCDAAVEVMGSARGNDLIRHGLAVPSSPKGEGLNAEHITSVFRSFIRATQDEIAIIQKQFGEAGA
jgi:hypothetical protein